MPTRILRDGILTSKKIAALSEPAQLMYRCLMSVVDDYGRTEADPDILRAKCFPVQLDRWPVARVAKVLAELGESPCVTVYHRDSRWLLQVENFGQRVQSKEKYPAPDRDSGDVENKELRRITENHGESPWLSVKSESESESESEKTFAHSPKPRTLMSDWFEREFWPHWPVKENRAAAAKAAMKVKESDRAAIIQALPKWAPRILAMDRPIHAATWLNNRRWEDESHVPQQSHQPSLIPQTIPDHKYSGGATMVWTPELLEYMEAKTDEDAAAVEAKYPHIDFRAVPA